MPYYENIDNFFEQLTEAGAKLNRLLDLYIEQTERDIAREREATEYMPESRTPPRRNPRNPRIGL